MKRSIIITLVSVLVAVGASVLFASQSTATDDPEVCTEKVLDQAAYDETVSPEHWQRYSWTGGPHDKDTPPPFPSEHWQPNVKGDPHGIGVAGAYWRSHGNKGKGDWFYLELVPAVIVHHDATYKEVEVPCEEVPPTDEPPVDPPVVDPPADDDPPVDKPVDKPKTDTPVTHESLPNTGA